ncbi:glycosyltransferase family 4 protein [Luteolibacter yonseiensis]
MLPPVDVIYERQWRPMPYPIFALQRLGCMGTLYGGFPKFRYTRSGIPADIVKSFPVATVWNHARSKYNLPSFLAMDEPKTLARWVRSHSDLAPAVWSNGTVHRFLFSHLKPTGRKLILERGSMHPFEHFHYQQRARREAGLSFTEKTPDSVLHEIEQTDLADAVLSCSATVRRSYLDHGFDPAKIHDCDFGIDTGEFPRMPREVARGRPIRIGVVGMIGFRKGVWRVIRIAEWAKRSGLPIEVHFVGPIENPEAAEMLAKSDGNYKLHGVLKGAALKKMLQSLDLYMLPSYEEGLPFSVLEAMSSGLAAIVSTDTGACEAAVDDVSGVHLTSFTDEEFDRKLRPLLEDPEKIMSMGDAARARILENYTIDHYYGRIRTAMERIFSIA